MSLTRRLPGESFGRRDKEMEWTPPSRRRGGEGEQEGR